jgi:RNA polymerase sigma-70 factor (ECF subfamily)
MMWRYAYAQCRRNVHLAEDVVAETFLALVKGLAGLEADGGHFAAWLTQVARHKIADSRRRGAGQWLHAKPLSELDLVADARSAGDPAALEQSEVVAAVMMRLDDQERLILEWKYLEGRSVRQISQSLGRSEKAVESLLFRARRSFQTLLQDMENSGDNHHGERTSKTPQFRR